MRLFIQGMDGYVHAIDVDPAALVHDVTVALWPLTKIPPQAQGLLYASRQLDEWGSLSAQHVPDGARLDMILRLYRAPRLVSY